MQDISITEARARLGELVDQVRYSGEPILLTKSGKAAAAVVTVSMYERLQRERKDLFDAIRAIQKISPLASASEEEVEQYVNALVHEVREIYKSSAEPTPEPNEDR